ncbi:MAG: amino acid--[acyl-carrier-protein] ligase [Candidatus Binataceae bacterium]
MSHVAPNRLDSPDPLDAIAAALFQPGPCGGVRAGTALFENVIEGLTSFISRKREPEMEVLRYPPVMSRRQVEKSGYLRSFPNLLGCVSCLDGKEIDLRALAERRDANDDWATGLSATDLVLTPAACYPLYPMAAARGHLPAQGLLFDVASYCFRHEATHEIDRLQSFRMREFVFMGTSSQAIDFRGRWIDRTAELASQLVLPHRIAPASDPFFGRVGKLVAMLQVEQALKFEWLIPVLSEEEPTACMSFNCHRDHFGTTWNLQTEDGEPAHTACVAFGIDRLGLALFATHGLDLQTWPAAVRKALSI